MAAPLVKLHHCRCLGDSSLPIAPWATDVNHIVRQYQAGMYHCTDIQHNDKYASSLCTMPAPVPVPVNPYVMPVHASTCVCSTPPAGAARVEWSSRQSCVVLQDYNYLNCEASLDSNHRPGRRHLKHTRRQHSECLSEFIMNRRIETNRTMASGLWPSACTLSGAPNAPLLDGGGS
jgi:hypothetical protein